MRKRVLHRLLFLCSCLLLALPAASFQNSGSLIDQSFALSQNLTGNQRLFYLTELTRVSALIIPPPPQAQEWCQMLFRVASLESDRGNRIAGQKNALKQLAAFNPALALARLHDVEVRKPAANQMLYEDFRSNAVEAIFLSFLKVKPQGLSTVEAQARYVGETGQYPYRAMAAVLDQTKPPTQDTNDIVSEALSFYAQETGYINRDEEFLVFLKALPGSNVDKDIGAQVVSTFAQRITHEPVQSYANYYGEVQLPHGPVVPFTDRNRAFLFQAFPVIHYFNASVARKLEGEFPELAQAGALTPTDEMLYISGGFVRGNPSSEQVLRQHIQRIQDSLLDRIQERIEQGDPQSAADLAQRLTGVSERIVGFSSAIPTLAQTNLSEARNIYERQVSELSNVNDPSSKLKATVALAQAAAAIGDSQRYRTLSASAFDQAVTLFARDKEDDKNSEGRYYSYSGFQELKELVIFTASKSGDVLQTKVRHVSDDWLRAHLLLYEAEGQAKAHSGLLTARSD